MHQLDWHINIASADKAGALAAIKAMPESSRWSWVSSNEVLSAETLEEALKAWRWEAVADKQGNINYLHFMGEKYGEDPLLLKAIAPFVEDGSFIEMQGEDGERWLWRFSDGELETLEAQISYGYKRRSHHE
tara:strand:- start:737 stop:1132 length:396 start_codon:yes stop_codon:yes gene_type:complete